MIVVRAPFRIPLGGGGTDLPSYYQKYGGELTSVAIDKYAYVVVNRQVIDKKIRVKYSLVEEVDNASELKHDLLREALKLVGIKDQIEFYFFGDLPARSGMGTSGSYLVAILKALHTLKGESVSIQELAEEACQIEISKLNKPVGKQDQYVAAFGNIINLKIDKKGTVKVNKPNLPTDKISDLENSLLIFYTGLHRDAADVLRHQNKSIKKDEKLVINSMHGIKKIGGEILKAIEAGDTIKVGELMDFHWQNKKNLSSVISTPLIDNWYEKAKQAGALGGKIMGAGGGGFLLFSCPNDKTNLRQAMKKEGLQELFFKFDTEGVKVVADFR